MGTESFMINKESATTGETTKEGKTYRNPTERKDSKKITAEKSDYTTERDKSKDIGKRRKTQKIPGKDQTIQIKQVIPK